MLIWIVLIGLLLFGFLSAFLGGVITAVLSSYSDPVSQIILLAMPAIFIFLWVFVKLFQGERR